MMYKSLENSNHCVDFNQAIINGISPDKGLYYPVNIPHLPKKFIENISEYDLHNIALEVIRQYVGNNIPDNELLSIIKKTLSFPFPIYEIHKNIYSLELFHGPTLAFKDVGTKFMALYLDYLQKIKFINKKITIIVATSGDTGAAVAKNFYGMKNINVVILYPKNRISEIQEKQISTLGNNIISLEISGTFDDCQNLVKTIFLDKDLKENLNITSANSINIARLLPQMFYYFSAYKQLKEKNLEIIFSVPSGNFGNICAGIISKKMGLPIKEFISATNINDTIPRFLKTGKYEPKKTIPTISNAMDISNPNNFTRIQNLYEKSFSLLKKEFYSYSFNDKETIDTIINVEKKYKYILDPHGAIGYLGLNKHLSKLGNKKNIIGVFIETAHPIKFFDKMPNFFSRKLHFNNEIKNLINRKKLSIKIPNNFTFLKQWLLNNIL